MKKRIIALLVILSMAIFSGCGQDKQEDTVEIDLEETEKNQEENGQEEENLTELEIQLQKSLKKGESTRQTITRLLNAYEDDGEITSALEAVIHSFYEKGYRDLEKEYVDTIQDRIDETKYMLGGITDISIEDCQNYNYATSGSIGLHEPYYHHYSFVPMNRGEVKSIELVFPRIYADLEDIEADGQNLFASMEHEGIKFDFRASIVDEMQYEKIEEILVDSQRLAEHYSYDFCESGILLQHDFRSDKGLENTTFRACVYDIELYQEAFRKVIAKQSGFGDYTAIVEITIPLESLEEADNTASVDFCLDLIKRIDFNNSDMYEVIRNMKHNEQMALEKPIYIEDEFVREALEQSFFGTLSKGALDKIEHLSVTAMKGGWEYDLSELGMFKNLKYLRLILLLGEYDRGRTRVIPPEEVLAPVKELKNLKFLELFIEPEQLTEENEELLPLKLDFLCDAQNMEHLNIEVFDNSTTHDIVVTDYSALPEMPNLRFARIWTPCTWGDSPLPSDISKFTACSNLEVLQLTTAMPDDEEVRQAVKGLENLEILDIHSPAFYYYDYLIMRIWDL